jgi:tetratricopeptide (TPR) repeat protein
VGEGGGPLAGVVARGLLAAGAGGDAVFADLPAAGDDVDRFVLAHLAGCLRDGPGLRAGAAELARARDYVPACELLPLVLLGTGDHAGAEARALALEGRLGRATVVTRHVLGAARVGRKAYLQALEPLRDCVELTGGGLHNAWLNLGIALRHLERFDEADHALQRAEALRPGQALTAQARIALHCDRSEFAAAHRVVDALPPQAAPPGLHAQLRGHVELAAALACVDDAGRRRACAQRAADHFRDALQQGAARKPLRGTLAQVGALLHEDRAGALDALWLALAADPTNVRDLRNAVRLLDGGSAGRIDPTGLRGFLSALARQLAPDGTPPAEQTAASRASQEPPKER